MSRLITASLVGAIDWCKGCPPSWKERAFRDLRKQLAREYDEEKPLTMRRGIAFEDAVQAFCINSSNKGSDHFKWFVEQCRGGVFQKKVKRFITIKNDAEYCVYGKIDVWFKDVIKDIKTTGRYGGRDRYLSSFQHKLYCYIEQIPCFEYLIAEFDGDTNTIVDHHTLTYTVTDWQVLLEEIVSKIEGTMKFLRDIELFELYNTSFSRY